MIIAGLRVIPSILDTDFYKLTMQAAVISQYPDVRVGYAFNNRRTSQKFTPEAFEALQDQITKMGDLRTTEAEIHFLRKNSPFLPEWYFSILQSYKFDPSEVQLALSPQGDLQIHIEGLWWKTILWEVPLLALVSWAYFTHVDTDWDLAGQIQQINAKADILDAAGCLVSDMSTRRRRDLAVQDLVVRELKKHKCFVGTSNPYFAMKHDVKCIGTMAHEWIMAHQVLQSREHCNAAAMRSWQKVYKGALGVALTDTVGSDAFFDDIDMLTARAFDGLRHDSGPWEKYVEKAVAFYEKHNIDPKTKTIIFSDGLNPELAAEICRYCDGKIKCAFGIGTNFSNDFGAGSPALNIVIKLIKVFTNNRWKFVVKTSDTPTKAIGQKDAQRVMDYIINGTPLDDPKWN